MPLARLWPNQVVRAEFKTHEVGVQVSHPRLGECRRIRMT
jgi:hypothetical protein